MAREGGREAAASAQSAEQLQQDHWQVIPFTLPLKLIYLNILLKALFLRAQRLQAVTANLHPLVPIQTYRGRSVLLGR